MSTKHHLKRYVKNMSYHVYNRGARQEVIFHDKYDFICFRRILFGEADKREPHLTLEYYCILPNHYHLLINQQKSREIVSYQSSIALRYGRYYRKKYYHHGRLFESSYKAICLPHQHDINRTIDYILSNPAKKGYLSWPYFGKKTKVWSGDNLYLLIEENLLPRYTPTAIMVTATTSIGFKTSPSSHMESGI